MKVKKIVIIISFLMMAFLAGNGAAIAVAECFDRTSVKLETSNLGLSFGNEGETPIGNSSKDELKNYDAFYVGDNTKKIIYLTFDCGYENGNMEKILAALKKHNVCATFFVVGNFLETNPELVDKMVKDGHIIGNHSYHHLDMSNLSKEEAFDKLLKRIYPGAIVFPEDEIQSINAGMNCHIEKPITISKLLEVVEKYCDKK